MKIEINQNSRNGNWIIKPSDELIEIYKIESGDNSEPVNPEEFAEWVNSLIKYALESDNHHINRDDSEFLDEWDTTSETGGV